MTEVKEGFFKGLWRKFQLKRKSKQELVDYIQNIHGVMEIQIDKMVNTLQELDQNKVYYMQIDNEYEIELVKKLMARATKGMKWTPPVILFGATDVNVVYEAINEKKRDELVELLKEMKIR